MTRADEKRLNAGAPLMSYPADDFDGHLLRPFLYRSYIVLISFLYFYIGTI